MSSTEKPLHNQPQDPHRVSLPDDALPPVEAPSAGFVLQLFLIPMIIVAIIVTVWLMFSWLAHMGSNPRDLVKGLQRGDDAAWQKAGILADMLRDQRKEHLKYDPALAKSVAEVLQQQIEEANRQQYKIKLRLFLCRALGEFHVVDVLPVLLDAATVERDAASIEPSARFAENGFSESRRKLTEIDVRRAALEALAVLVKNVGADELRSHDPLLQVLVDASGERGDPQRDEYLRRELRSAATYALGVLGGEQALARLTRNLDDPYPNARFNAATGLARHGDARAVRELVEMLDPENDEVIKEEQHESGKAFKRSLVITNAIQASMTLAEANRTDDLKELEAALTKLNSADVPISVRIKSKEAVELFKRRRLSVYND